MKPAPIADYLDHIGRGAGDKPSPRRDVLAVPPAQPAKPAGARVRRRSTGRPWPPRPRSPWRRRRRRAPRGAADPAPVDAAPRDVARRARGGEGRGNGAPDRGGDASAAARRARRSGAPKPRSGSPPSARRCRSRRSWSGSPSSSTNTPQLEATVAGRIRRGRGERRGGGRPHSRSFPGEGSSRYAADELVKALGRLTAGGAPGLITIRGPERLLSLLRDRVADLPADIDYVEDGGVEASSRATPRGSSPSSSPGPTSSPRSTT